MKIGLLQTHALGDIIIALPIAQYFIREGHEVYWPIDEIYLAMIEEAIEEKIQFIPIRRSENAFLSLDYFVNVPISRLKSIGCDKIFPLYSALGQAGKEIINETYFNSLKFDEYKYAISGVPFQEKWNLKIRRNTQREKSLVEKLNIKKSFILVHEIAGDGEVTKISLPYEIKSNFQIISISHLTNSIFDWLGAYELASGIFLIDSAHSNLVEQLNIGINKHLKVRSSVNFTPVFKNGWIFL